MNLSRYFLKFAFKASFGALLSVASVAAPWAPLAVLGVVAPTAHADYPGPVPAVVLPAPELRDAISSRRLRPKEHARVAELAKERGLRVFLFGGTAANFARYVKWSLESEKGLRDFRSEYFSYDFTKVYRENQDFDIVIARADGTPETIEEIREFQRVLENEFPYFQSQKTAWEVRGFRTRNGDKEALFEDWDFANQHSDTQSTGLIELTEPLRGESVLRDVRDLQSQEPRFLRDLATDRIHLYFAENHGRTNRAVRGENDPIVEVIRLVRKAVQSGASIDSESLSHLHEIVMAFDPTRSLNSYTKKRLLREAEKIVTNAIDLEHAWNLLDELGLREKLIRIGGDPNEVGTVAWKLSREPLRSTYDEAIKRIQWERKAGQAQRTAQELGIDTVAHATKTIEAYLSITSSPFARPNFFYSRRGKTGEMAAEGDGVYAAVGTKGYGPFSVVLSVDPDALEGRDFLVHHSGAFITISNSSKFHVIPAEFKPDVDEAIRMLFESNFDDGQWALLERVLRWMKNVKLSEAQGSRLAEVFLAMTSGQRSAYSFGPDFEPARMHYLLELSNQFVDRISDDRLFDAIFLLRAGRATESALSRTPFPALGSERDRFAAVLEQRLNDKIVYAEIVRGLEGNAVDFVGKLNHAKVRGDWIHHALTRLGTERPDLALKFSMVPSTNLYLYEGYFGDLHTVLKIDCEANRKAIFTASYRSKQNEVRFVAEANALIKQLQGDFSGWREAIRVIISNPFSSQHPELVEKIIDLDRAHLWGELGREILKEKGGSNWEGLPKFVERMLHRISGIGHDRDRAVENILIFFSEIDARIRLRHLLPQLNAAFVALGPSSVSRFTWDYLKVFVPAPGWLPTDELRDLLERAESWDLTWSIQKFLKDMKPRPAEWDGLYGASKISSLDRRKKYLASRMAKSSLAGACSRFLLRVKDKF